MSVSGDSVIKINRNRTTKETSVSQLYHKLIGGDSRGRVWDLTVPVFTSYADNNGALRLNRIRKIISRGEREVLEIKVETKKKEYKLEATPQTKLLTKNGWIELQDITISKHIAVNGKHIKYCHVCNEPTEHVDYPRARFFGECKACVYKTMRRAINQNHLVMEYGEVTSLVPKEGREVFDIITDGPDYNFIANGIILK